MLVIAMIMILIAMAIRAVDRLGDEVEYALRCNLLQHAIFQQVLTLTALGARAQALQLIAHSRATCYSAPL